MNKPRNHSARDRSVARDDPWANAVALFPPLNGETKHFLESFPEILQKIWPLKTQHRKSLPQDIAALSRILTSERNALDLTYWSKPAFVSAYLYYFLPWNLVRMARLFQGLPLTPPRPSSLLADSGSGPLTLPLALWLSRPDWRKTQVRVLALDTASQPLELGKRIFACLPDLRWEVRTARSPLNRTAAAATAEIKQADVQPWLLTYANVLNELPERKTKRGSSLAHAEETEEDNWLEQLQPMLDAGAHALFVEPGTRLGGSKLMRLRDAALDLGLASLAPCTHNNPCPLQGRESAHRGSLESSWCHFTFAAQDVPRWLLELSEQAGLAKKSLSIATLLLGGAASLQPDNGRVISQGFLVPGQPGKCRYVCCAHGLGLIANSSGALSGSLVRVKSSGEKDQKSGAFFMVAANADKAKIGANYATRGLAGA